MPNRTGATRLLRHSPIPRNDILDPFSDSIRVLCQDLHASSQKKAHSSKSPAAPSKAATSCGPTQTSMTSSSVSSATLSGSTRSISVASPFSRPTCSCGSLTQTHGRSNGEAADSQPRLSITTGPERLAKYSRAGSGLGTSLLGRGRVQPARGGRGKFRGRAPSSRPPPGAGPVLSSTGEDHAASLETRSPSSWRTAVSLGSATGRPIQFSKNLDVPARLPRGRTGGSGFPGGEKIEREKERGRAGARPRDQRITVLLR